VAQVHVGLLALLPAVAAGISFVVVFEAMSWHAQRLFVYNFKIFTFEGFQFVR